MSLNAPNANIAAALRDECSRKLLDVEAKLAKLDAKRSDLVAERQQLEEKLGSLDGTLIPFINKYEPFEPSNLFDVRTGMMRACGAPDGTLLPPPPAPLSAPVEG